MTTNKKILKGSDILHMKYFRIEREFEKVTKFLEFIDEELLEESKQIQNTLDDTITFNSDEDESNYYGYFQSDLASFQNYFPLLLKKYIFIGMFGLFETSFKLLVYDSFYRIKCNGIVDAEERKLKIIEIKTNLHKKPLQNIKEEFVCLHKNKNSNNVLFDSLWLEISKFKELRNSIIHNDCDVTKNIEPHWKYIYPKTKSLEDFIILFFKDELFIENGKFIIANKDFLFNTETIYKKTLEVTKTIIVNHKV